MDPPELYNLKWTNYYEDVSAQWRRIRDEEELFDVTFACEGRKLGAHKLILFTCSPYFRDIMKDNACTHPIFYMSGVKYELLKAIIEYMYQGQVQVPHTELREFISLGEQLQIRGLSKDRDIIEFEDGIVDVKDEDPDNTMEFSVVKKTKFSTSLEEDQTQPQHHQLESTQHLFKQHKTHVPKVQEHQPQHHHETQQQHQTHTPNSNNMLATVQQQQQQLGHDKLEASGNLCFAPSRSDGGGGGGSGGSLQGSHPWIEKTEYELSILQDEKYIQAETHHHQQPQQQLQLQHSQSTGSDHLNESKSPKPTCLAPSSCTVCGKVYSNVSNLRQHMRLIHNPTAVCCAICQKSFNSELYLKRHYSSMHGLGGTPNNSSCSSNNSNSSVKEITNKKTISATSGGANINMHWSGSYGQNATAATATSMGGGGGGGNQTPQSQGATAIVQTSIRH